jgi:uncharacterized membrane protein
MKPQQPIQNAIASEELKVVELKQNKRIGLQEIERQRAQERKLTLGQRIADKMAAKVGSWGFLIGQTTVLTGWVTMNLMPGVPHWDESPFILLNLMFSFASAYTAPIVLMSQNRQSDAEREKSEYDHQVNLKAGYDIELLHEKMDALQAQQIQELTLIVKEQQRCLNEMKSSVLPVLQQQQRSLNEIKVSVLPVLQNQQQSLNEIKVTDSQFPSGYSVYFPFNAEQ